MPPLKQHILMQSYKQATSNTTRAQSNEELCLFCTATSEGHHFFHSCMDDGVRVMCADSSPYSTIHQVLPGGHVEETVQGELVREQLENIITQVWFSHRVSNPNPPQVFKKLLSTLSIVSWSTGTDLSHGTKVFTSGLELVHKSNPPSIMARLKPWVKDCMSLHGCYTQQKHVSCFRRQTD